MNNSTPKYEERLKNHQLQLIDFSFIINHPEYISEVWNKYSYDIVFKTNVDQKMKSDVIFRRKFLEIFSSFINQKNAKTDNNKKLK